MEMKHLPIILTAVLSLSCFDAKTLSAGEKEMEITSSGIENGRIEDKYGKRGDDFINNVPSLSLPLIIHNAPPGTKSFALILRDEDAAPVVGYPWIHWLAANIRERSWPKTPAAANRILFRASTAGTCLFTVE